MAAQVSPPPAARRPLPRTFGRYVLFDFIGKGGMAEIYLARATTSLGPTRLCVVKQIAPELARIAPFADMLVHEAKLAASLNHANIVQVFDLGRERDDLFIAMDYVEGFDLNEILRRCSRGRIPFPFELALRIVTEALRGLSYAHRATDDRGRPLGIVHRDVSPSNVLVSFEGEVKLCDFGIAHANDVALREGVADEALKGKAGYMSPEQARGEPVDARSDLFAVGILLWELLAGTRMYRVSSGEPRALLALAQRAEIPPLPERPLPGFGQLHAIVNKALAPHPDERYESAQQMLRDLEDYAIDHRLTTSPLKLGAWMIGQFGTDIVVRRRERERALDRGGAPAPRAVGRSPRSAPLPLPYVVLTILFSLAVLAATFVALRG